MRKSKIAVLATLITLGSCFSAQAAEEAGAPVPVDKARISSLIKTGVAASNKADYAKAVGCFNEAVTLDQQCYEGYVHRGWAFRKMGDMPRAISDYTEALKLQPKKPQVYLNRGWCYRRLNEHQEAMADFNKAIEIDPKYVNAYRNRGSLKLKMGDYNGAINDFNQLLGLDPNAKSEVAKFIPPDLLADTKFLEGGKPELNKAAKEELTAKLSKAFKGTKIQISDSELAKMNNRAAVAIKNGEFDSAIKILEDLSKKKPEYNFARENLTTAYNNQGLKLARQNSPQSVDQFRMALFYSPEQSAARANLNSMIKATGKDPNSDQERLRLGDDLKGRGDYKGAFVEYMEAMRLKNSADARRKMSEVCLLIDQQKEETKTVLATSATDSGTTPSASSPVTASTESANETNAVAPTPGQTVESSKPADPPTPMDGSTRINISEAPTPTANPEPSSSSSEDFQRLLAHSSFRGATQETPAPPVEIPVAKKEKMPEALSAETLSLPSALTRDVPIGQDDETIRLKWQTKVIQGDAYFEQGNYVEAESEYKDSLAAARKLGTESQELCDSLERISRIFLVQKRPAEALSLLEQAYTLRKVSAESGDAGVERLGKKVIALRGILYPNAKTAAEKEDEEEEEEHTTVGKRVVDPMTMDPEEDMRTFGTADSKNWDDFQN